MNTEEELLNLKDFKSNGRFTTSTRLGIIVPLDEDAKRITYMERVLIDGSLYAVYGKSEIARKPYGEITEIIFWSHKVMDEFSKMKQGSFI